jgi:hypothetical protein
MMMTAFLAHIRATEAFSLFLLSSRGNPKNAKMRSTITPDASFSAASPVRMNMISQYFGDPARLEIVNGVIETAPQLQEVIIEPPPEVIEAVQLVQEEEEEEKEVVKPYEAAPLARVEPTLGTAAVVTKKKYSGRAVATSPSKRQTVVGLESIVKQQVELNLHCLCSGDTSTDLNTEFTTFL